ncbi:flagellin N-terminal helical domain-containing protein [Campylobacter sp. RM16187]|uniref:flagellin N-terminal helical domain-containing protein n=1 Tax=Campylobacter sp. RM16187 TaxID=1660063 RepID=UPI0021B5C053|nr:flagellin [Campylobacter sp. RM16187]QKG29230.1 flagellar hook-associated protein [Campylobacter sp. RM16187]
MRITNQLMKFNDTYNYQVNMKELYRLNTQISSGLKIQNSFEDSSIYNDGMRLDYEVATLNQVQDATSKAGSFSLNTDKALKEFKEKLELFKTKLVQAGNEHHSKTSREALANDLQGIKNHLVNIANTSINGQFLFSGSAINTKPINGTTNQYFGNSQEMRVVGGSQVKLAYNMPGEELFLGRDGDYNKHISTNVMLTDQSVLNRHDNIKYLNEESKIRNMIGFNYVKDEKTLSDLDFGGPNAKSFQNTTFYLQGKKPDGTTFTSKFQMTADASIKDLMEKIGTEYGNTPNNRVVDVTINNEGQFNIKDLSKGNQVIDFHMIGVTRKLDNEQALTTANINTASNHFNPTNSLEDLEAMVNANPNDFVVTEFVKSNYNDINGNQTNAFDYDRVKFKNDGRHVVGTVSQIARKSGEFATDNTTLSEVAGTEKLYNGESRKYNIDGQSLQMSIKSKHGGKYTVSMTFSLNGLNPNFTIKGTMPDGAAVNYNTPVWDSVYNPVTDSIDGVRTHAKDVTFRQLNDIISFVVNDNIPNPDAIVNPPGLTQLEKSFLAYQQSIKDAQGSVEVNMDHRGRIKITDKQNTNTPIEVAIFDRRNSDIFAGDSTGNTPATSQGVGSVFTFSANNALDIDVPSVDIFSDLDNMIEAVRLGQYRADSNGPDPRNSGIQGAIERIDHIFDHVNKLHTKVGALSNSLKDTNTRASILSVNVKTVKSEIVDADYGETYMHLMQKMMSYQAMLQSVAKVNQLTLLNYM